jgi:hypothetical protein
MHESADKSSLLRTLDAVALGTAVLVVLVVALALAEGDVRFGAFLLALAASDFAAVAWARRRRASRDR